MTHQYRCLRLWLASLFLLAGMHTNGFSMNDGDSTSAEERSQSILRGLQARDPSTITGIINPETGRAFIFRQAEQRHKLQPLGFFCTESITPAILAYSSDHSSVNSALSCLSSTIAVLANENDSLIQKALGNTRSWTWNTYNGLLLGGVTCSLFYALLDYELARNINIAIMTTHAVVKTGLYAYDWWNSESYED